MKAKKKPDLAERLIAELLSVLFRSRIEGLSTNCRIGKRQPHHPPYAAKAEGQEWSKIAIDGIGEACHD